MADLNGLPAVEGLGDFLANDPEFKAQDKDPATVAPDVQIPQQAPAPATDGQAPTQTMSDEEVLAQFKSTKDLLKSYKEIQGFTTRVSQENKAKDAVIGELQTKLNALQEEIELRSYQGPARPGAPAKSFEELFIENPEQAITVKAMEIANTQRITEVLDEKRAENPQDFQERVAYVQMLAQQPQYAQLSHSPKGVQKLFEIADKTRTDMTKRKAHESLKVIFGEDVDLEKLRAIVRGDGGQQPPVNGANNPQLNRNAYMPDTSTSTRTGADINARMNNIQALKEEAVKKGDPSAVAGAMVREALLK